MTNQVSCAMQFLCNIQVKT